MDERTISAYANLLREKQKALENDEYMRAFRLSQHIDILEKKHKNIREKAIELMYRTREQERLCAWLA